MGAHLLLLDDSGRIITFDVTESEGHSGTAIPTDHPVEVGADITDHVRPEPVSFTLLAFTTETPIYAVGDGPTPGVETAIMPSHPLQIQPNVQFLVNNLLDTNPNAGGPLDYSILRLDSSKQRVRETYEKLLEIEENVILVEVVTSLRTYKDMALISLSVPRTAGESGGSTFTMTFRQLRVIESARVASPPVPADNVPGGVPLKEKGSQGAKTPPPGADKAKTDSIAKRMADSKFVQGLF